MDKKLARIKARMMDGLVMDDGKVLELLEGRGADFNEPIEAYEDDIREILSAEKV